VLDLSWVHRELAPYYSHTGRPSIDPVLMIRMLIVGYVFAIRSERRICAEVRVNLAYRWFCKLGIEDKIPDHSVFCRARNERFRESDALRRVFEGVVGTCIAAGLVGGEAFSIDASLIKADVDKKKRAPGDQPIAWPKAEETSRAVREYLAILDAARNEESGDGDGDGGGSSGDGGSRRKPPERSLVDRSAGDMGCQAGRGPILRLRCELSHRQQGRDHCRRRGHARQSYSGNQHHRDHDRARQTPLRSSAPEARRRQCLWRGQAAQVAGGSQDHAACSGDKSARHDGTFSRADFVFDRQRNVYICPGGAELTSTGNIDQGHIVYYRANRNDCSACSLKPKCTTAPMRKVTRDVNEDVRDRVRALANTEAFQQSSRERKKVEMRFAHMKRILRLDRLRLRGLSGAKDEVLLTATAQNLRRLAKLLCRAPPAPVACPA